MISNLHQVLTEVFTSINIDNVSWDATQIAEATVLQAKVFPHIFSIKGRIIGPKNTAFLADQKQPCCHLNHKSQRKVVIQRQNCRWSTTYLTKAYLGSSAFLQPVHGKFRRSLALIFVSVLILSAFELRKITCQHERTAHYAP